MSTSRSITSKFQARRGLLPKGSSMQDIAPDSRQDPVCGEPAKAHPLLQVGISDKNWFPRFWYTYPAFVRVLIIPKAKSVFGRMAMFPQVSRQLNLTKDSAAHEPPTSTQGVGHENFPCAAQLLQPLASLLEKLTPSQDMVGCIGGLWNQWPW